MRPRSQYYCILVVDIEKFGSRRNPVQAELRKRLYELTESAFREAGVDVSTGPAPVDRGDGYFRLLPAGLDKTDLTGRFVELLHHRLRAHAALSSEEGALRLRVALHAGDVAGDEHGWVGAELNTACRLVDIDPLRTALREAPRAGLALAVSDDWYRAAVAPDDPSVVRESFRRVPFDAKEIQGAHAWIRVPGYSTPPGLEGAPVAGPAGSAGDEAPRPGRGRPGGDVHVRNLGTYVAGDQHVQRQTFTFGDDGTRP